MSSQAAHRTRTLWLTAILHAFTHLYQMALIPVYLRIQHDFQLKSVGQATLLVTIMGAAYFLPSYPMGVMADRFCRKKLLALGLTINALGFVGLAFAPSYASALVCMVIAGFGGSFYHPAATALIARTFPEARGRALGWVGTGASFGFCAGPLYSGWRAAAAGSWRAPVLELGVLGLVVAGLFYWFATEDRAAAAIVETPLSGKKQKMPMFPSGALWALFLGAALFFCLRDLAGYAMSTSASLFLQKARGYSLQTTGLALATMFLASAVSNPLFGRLSDGGRGRWGTFVLLMAAGLICLFPHVSGRLLAPALLAYGFFFMSSYPITEAALMEAVPDEVRGRVFGLFITIGGFVGNVGHWLAGGWINRLGDRDVAIESYYPLFTSLALLPAIATLGLPLLKALRRRENILEPSAEPTPAPAPAPAP